MVWDRKPSLQKKSEMTRILTIKQHKRARVPVTAQVLGMMTTSPRSPFLLRTTIVNARQKHDGLGPLVLSLPPRAFQSCPSTQEQAHHRIAGE